MRDSADINSSFRHTDSIEIQEAMTRLEEIDQQIQEAPDDQELVKEFEGEFYFNHWII